MSKIVGNDSGETIAGTKYADTIYGAGGDDLLQGGAGDDVLEGGYGNDTLRGGAGDDTIRLEAWGGEPVARNGQTVNPDEPFPDNDVAYGGSGADVFQVTWLIDGKDDIVELYRDPDSGYVNYNMRGGGLAGNNASLHNHWVETIGVKTIGDFEVGVDTLDLRGHTIYAKSVSYNNGDTIVDFHSVQNGGGAHGTDSVGRLIIKDAILDESEFVVNKTVHFGVETMAKTGTTNTGLDKLVDTLLLDPGLSASNPTHLLLQGVDAADALSNLLLDSIKATAIAKDGNITVAEARDLNAYIQAKHADEWAELYGQGDGDGETGYHLLLNDGANGSALFGANPADTIGPWLFNIGRQLNGNRFDVPAGEQQSSIYAWTKLINKFLKEDLQKGTFADGSDSGDGGSDSGDGGSDSGDGGGDSGDGGSDGGDGGGGSGSVNPINGGTTNTGLDILVKTILTDPGLAKSVSLSDVQEGAAAADEMNGIIVDSIKDLGFANNGKINMADVRDLNAYVKANYYDEWVELHGDDERTGETGFHLVQNDGSTSQMFGVSAIDKVADSIYHLAFDIVDGGYVLVNEDGVRNISVEKYSVYLNDLLADDLKGDALKNPDVNPYVEGSTGTGLDVAVETIVNHKGLNFKLATSEIEEAAKAVDTLNNYIVEAVVTTGAASDDHITVNEVRGINSYLRGKYAGDWEDIYGDSVNGVDTGYHTILGEGGGVGLFGQNATETVIPRTLNIGRELVGNNFQVESGEQGSTVSQVAQLLNQFFEDDYAEGTFDDLTLA